MSRRYLVLSVVDDDGWSRELKCKQAPMSSSSSASSSSSSSADIDNAVVYLSDLADEAVISIRTSKDCFGAKCPLPSLLSAVRYVDGGL